MKYEITEEQIKEIEADGCTYVKEWFPEVFEMNTLNKWIVVEDKSFSFDALVYDNGEKYTYGFNYSGDWSVVFNNGNVKILLRKQIRLATDSEVEEALINEAKKRGFKDGVYVKTLWGELDYWKLDSNRFTFNNETNNLHLGPCVFNNGKWAEIVKTYTKEEAEKLLNAKII